MSRYGRVDVYGIRVVFIISLLSFIFYFVSEPVNYVGALVSVTVCGVCLFFKQVATEYCGTSNIRLIY
jgi:hypothetical protein